MTLDLTSKTGSTVLALLLLCCVAAAQTDVIPPDAPGYLPLSGHQRWDRFLKGYLASPVTYVASAGAAVGGEIGNDPKEWGQGVDGYGKRVASTFGLFTLQVGIKESGDAALRYDPRYFRCRCKGGWHRGWNALEMTFVAYDDKGRKRFDLPTVAGAYGSSMISTYWYPSRYSPLVQGVQQGHMQMGFVFGVNLIREFSPELKRQFRKLDPRARR